MGIYCLSHTVRGVLLQQPKPAAPETCSGVSDSHWEGYSRAGCPGLERGDPLMSAALSGKFPRGPNTCLTHTAQGYHCLLISLPHWARNKAATSQPQPPRDQAPGRG